MTKKLKLNVQINSYLEPSIVSRASLWSEDLRQPAVALVPAFDHGLDVDNQPFLQQGSSLKKEKLRKVDADTVDQVFM